MTLVIASHDAGGAEILSSYLRRNPAPCRLVLAGPARRIFEQKLGNIDTWPLIDALEGATWILTGTGWQSDLEFEALERARELRTRSVAFLDHWVNYRERFVRRGKTCLPDEVWVGDQFAVDIARKALPEVPARLVENPYFSDLREELDKRSPAKRSGTLGILYLCEPVREHARMRFGNERHWGYTEEDALRYFLSNAARLTEGSRQPRILIRPHPSEPNGKYDWAAAASPFPVEFSSGGPLTAEIAANDVIVGCNSTAMVAGLLAGKRVVSCIPPSGRACVLPQPAIQSLQRLVTPST